MTLVEIQDYLQELDDDTELVDVAIEPPLESAEADTDCDSDKSDDEVGCDPDHLPRRVLRSHATISSLEPQTEDSVAPAPKRRKKSTFVWHKDENKLEEPAPNYECTVDINTAINETVVEAMSNYWTDEWIGDICRQSIIYAQQKSLPYDQVNPENFKVFLSILVLSGFNRLPHRRLYWSEYPEVDNELVKASMRRKTFEQLLRCLHFTDNMAINDDRFYKVRPLFDHINKVCGTVRSGEYSSVDEIMVPYYGRHGDKQFIRGKPVRFGFKLWAAASSDGSLLFAEPYCGTHTRITDRGLGQGGNVVLECVEKLNLRKGQHIVFDNFFGSVALLKELGTRDVAGTCALREDRLSGAPLKSRKAMEKESRGSLDEAFTGNISVVKWKDNKVVSIASNKTRSIPLQKARRYDRVAKKYIDVDMPNSISTYNKHMGGVDLFDQQVATYRIRIRSKKWWWSLFSWSVVSSGCKCLELLQNKKRNFFAGLFKGNSCFADETTWDSQA